MRVAGIIAEYDPFHKGHAAHIQATRTQGGATHVVAVISGSLTQRGEPAAFSKQQRAQMALAGGADLVLELPVPWSMASAQRFATGGVAILNALGCVDFLSFGSECGSIPRLQQALDITRTEAYKTALQQKLKTGIPYAAAQQEAVAACDSDIATLLEFPNNTLGLEYLRAAADLQADFSFFALARQGALHDANAPKSGFASGSLLRKRIQVGDLEQTRDYLPPTSFSLLQQAIAESSAPADSEKIATSVLSLLRRMSPEEFQSLPYLSEGLENRLYKATQTATDYETLLQAVKTRRYPLARIRRVLWAALLGMQKADAEGLPPYIRLLGMNQRGREILAAASPTLPLLSRTAQLDTLAESAQRVFRLEATATDLRALLLPTPQPCGDDYTYRILTV